MPASNLIERVAELIAGGEELVPDALRPQLAELQRRLREPVRVAVVGRVSAGKSTMVNALLGQRVAPTDVSECTRLVTWFHYGHPQHLQIELKAGGTLDAQLTPDGTLPNTLDVPPEDIQGLHCYLANDLLKWMTLIDTPGDRVGPRRVRARPPRSFSLKKQTRLRPPSAPTQWCSSSTRC